MRHSEGFTNRRNNELLLGKATVELPATHRFGAFGRNWLSFFKEPKSDERRVVLIEDLDSDEFLGLSAMLMNRTSDQPSNLLYIHGFRNSFDDALLCGAQLGCDLKILGTTFVFSWPSNQTLSRYHQDAATVTASLPYLEQYILLLLKNFPDVPLHIIAHSMGNRALLRLFERLAATKERPGKLGQFIFAAADVDSDEFCNVVNNTKPIAKRMSVYSSRADLALQASEVLHGYQRVGLAPPLTLTSHTDTILVEGFDLFNMYDKYSHEYFVQSAAVMHDMFVLIKFDSPPNERQGLQKVEEANGTFWRLPLN